jgi:hypothetical protein
MEGGIVSGFARSTRRFMAGFQDFLRAFASSSAFGS